LPLPAGKPLSTFPLTPTDGFVLSRIDGSSADTDLVGLTGLPLEHIQDVLHKLAGLGLVAYQHPNPPAPPVPSAPAPPPPSAAAPRPTPAVPASDPELEAHPGMTEDVDLARDHRLRILDLERRLSGELHHYDLLGVGRDADKKAIKRAYYELAALFHPDRFFRKRLGSFKAKMEAIFTRITEAHDVLTDAERRAEYDGYIGEIDVARNVDADLLLDLPPPSSSQPAVALSTPPAPAPAPTTPPTSPSSGPPRIPSTRGISLPEQARRDALARRLLGNRSPSGAFRAPSSAPAPDPDALKRHYEQKRESTRLGATRVHLDEAAAAMAKNDVVAAATAYRHALELSPNDPEIRAAFEEAQRSAVDVLFGSYRKQAQYEEKNGHWPEAARSWQRAAKAKPQDPEPNDRAAFCLAKANGNLHEAAKLAQAAIALDPTRASYHVTLYLVYVAAGLGLNARREIETAARLAPGDETIQALLKRAGKA
jgi:curved DNA-binding protein CbpA